MKTSLKIFLFAFLMLLLQHCTDEQYSGSGIRITFQLAGGQDGSMETASSKGKLLVSIDNYSGEEVLDYHEVSFATEGSAFITEPFDLPLGSYTIKDFMFIDVNSQILFAVPKRNTFLGTSDDNSLMRNFNVTSDGNIDIHLEMLAVGKHQPKDFGYNSFRINRHSINLAVKIPDGGKARFTSAKAYILEGNDTIPKYALRPRINQISFVGSPDETYNLVVIKDGYGRYTRAVGHQYSGTAPHKETIIANLIPALTMVARTLDHGYFSMQIDGFPGQFL